MCKFAKYELIHLGLLCHYFMQLLNVYMPKYETGGKFWPIVHDATIFSLILTQAVAFGIFGSKKQSLVCLV